MSQIWKKRHTATGRGTKGAGGDDRTYMMGWEGGLKMSTSDRELGMSY